MCNSISKLVVVDIKNCGKLGKATQTLELGYSNNSISHRMENIIYYIEFPNIMGQQNIADVASLVDKA